MASKEVSTGYSKEQYTAAVTEYTSRRRDTMKRFLNDIVELGEILSKHREKMKETGQWMQFMEDTGLSVSTANQQIAMFEYVKKTGQEKLLEKVITNWSKMQLFMSLPEEKKNKVLETSEKEEESTQEFRERVGEIENEDVVVNNDDEDVLWSHLEEIAGEKADLMKLDPVASAAALQKEMGLPSRTKPILEALILMAKARELLDKHLPNLTPADRKVLGTMFSEQVEAVSTLSIDS